MADFTDPGIFSVPVDSNIDVVIQMVNARPILNQIVETRQAPGRIVGYYNAQLDAVELFVVGRSGQRWYKVQ